MTERERLQHEIDQQRQIVADNIATLYHKQVSGKDRAQLQYAVERRLAEIKRLEERLAALP